MNGTTEEDDMMVGYGGDLSGWGWVGMTLGMIAFWALLIAAIALVVAAQVDHGFEAQRIDRAQIRVGRLFMVRRTPEQSLP